MKKEGRSLTSLKELGRVLEGRKPAAVKKTPPVPPQRTDDELFRDAMADVREIREFRSIPPKPAPCAPVRGRRTDDSLAELKRIVSGRARIRLSDTGEYREWTHAGVRTDVTGRLHRGAFAIQDSIDLHGLTLAEAELEVEEFFRRAVQRRLFCVKVIHGRGLRSPQGPVLKEALGRWLQGRLRKRVLAYATARDCDGGLGATYVLLK